jgi:hypothetical protein
MKLTELSSELCRYLYKDSNKNLLCNYWTFIQFFMIFLILQDI